MSLSKVKVHNTSGNSKTAKKMSKEVEWRNQMKPIRRDQSKKDKPSWVLEHANKVFGILNSYFFVTGICICIAGFYFHGSIYAEMYEKGSNWSLTTGFMIFGLAVIFSSILGQIGYKKNIKCFLMIYWCMGFIAFVIDIVFATQFLGNRDIEKKGSEWWDDYNEAFRGEVQEEFSCCGYYDNDDRPALGCNLVAENDRDQPCRDKVRNEMNERLVPALLFFFICGIALFFAMLVTGKIVCRRTYSRKTPGLRGVAGFNQMNVSDIESDKENDNDRL